MGDEFLRQWKEVATDLTALDHTDAENVKSLGGRAGQKEDKSSCTSRRYIISTISARRKSAIACRIATALHGLSARSIQAIKASLDSGLTHEVHRFDQRSGLFDH